MVEALRKKLQATASVGVMLVAATAVSGPARGANAARLQSGVYEGLELTLAPDGAVAGAFTRDTDSSPHRICVFRFIGRLETSGRARVEVRSPLWPSAADEARPIKAVLAATNNGVTLHADGLTRYPACDQLTESGPGAGLEFTRTGAADGVWLATVSSARALLHFASTGGAWRGYVVKADDVVLGARNHGRWSAVFLSPDGRRSHGWIDAADLAPFGHR